MFCNKCGTPLADGEQVCPNCGANLAQERNEKMIQGAPHIGVSFGQAVKLFFQNYANFKGRASKSEYWCCVV